MLKNNPLWIRTQLVTTAQISTVALDWSSLVFYFHGYFLLASYDGWVPSQSPFHNGAKAF